MNFVNMLHVFDCVELFWFIINVVFAYIFGVLLSNVYGKWHILRFFINGCSMASYLDLLIDILILTGASCGRVC